MDEEKSKEEDNEQQQEKPEFEKKLEDMRRENERLEKNLKELKELKAYEALGGQTSQEQPQKKEEETPQEFRARVEQEMASGKRTSFEQ